MKWSSLVTMLCNIRVKILDVCIELPSQTSGKGRRAQFVSGQRSLQVNLKSKQKSL